MKALGIQWNRETDEIIYSVRADEFNSKITKRNVLSNIARLYDPIGLLGPVIVVAKILMQAIWQCKVEWDEALPQNIFTKWDIVREQLPILSKVKFDRKTIIQDKSCVQIHGFCDASEKAYGACIYIRSIDKNGLILTNLMCSKNRVAPLKVISLPKLELCGALLLCQLVKTVLNAIRVKVDDVFLWSDSSITLQWINTQPSSLKTFVANQVSEIRDFTNTMHWRYTPSQENAADILSRGQLPAEFLENTRCKAGPDWLKADILQWPENIVKVVPLIEVKETRVFNQVLKEGNFFDKYSSIDKAIRVTAYVMRFKDGKLGQRGPITINELKRALMIILKHIQGQNFKEEIKQLAQNGSICLNSSLRALNPFLDDNTKTFTAGH